jgi:DNA-binding MarR family transcriptional regulator/N-acetylglutamate synthase-like GNAT family acetyltransferase
MSSTAAKLSYLAGVTRFRRISEKLYIDGDKVYSEAGIKFKASWFSVYYVLAITDSPLTIMQISEQIDFTHITVKNVIRELEEEELVSVTPNPSDKRSKLVSLSTKGQKQIYRLKPLWISYSTALKNIFQIGHPDFMNILQRIDNQIEISSIQQIIEHPDPESIIVIDYRPGLDKHFHELAGPWLTGEANGILEEEDGIALQKPEEAHFMEGGFIFYAMYKDQIVGFAALKRLTDYSFECSSLFVNPNYRNNGIDIRLIERCICRSLENQASELWIQISVNTPELLDSYQKLGFEEKDTPSQIQVLEQTQKVMCLDL